MPLVKLWEGLVRAASMVTTLQALIALGLLILFGLFYVILDLEIFVQLNGNQTFELLFAMVKGIILILLALVVLGLAALVITKVWGKREPVGPPPEVTEAIARWLPSDFGLKAARGRWEKAREPGEPWPGRYVKDQDAEDAAYSTVHMVLGNKSRRHALAMKRLDAFRRAENLADWPAERDKLREEINAIFS